MVQLFWHKNVMDPPAKNMSVNLATYICIYTLQK